MTEQTGGVPITHEIPPFVLVHFRSGGLTPKALPERYLLVLLTQLIISSVGLARASHSNNFPLPPLGSASAMIVCGTGQSYREEMGIAFWCKRIKYLLYIFMPVTEIHPLGQFLQGGFFIGGSGLGTYTHP